MNTEWRKLGPILAGVSGLYILLVGAAADFAQVLSFEHGIFLLILLFIITLCYCGWKWAQKFWNNYCALQNRLEEARDLIMRSAGESSNNVLLCAKTRCLQRSEWSIHVSELRFDGRVALDVSRIALELEPSGFLDVHFSILSSDGESAKGIVQSCDLTQACVELYEWTKNPNIGDLAIPIAPPETTELERLLGRILFIVSE